MLPIKTMVDEFGKNLLKKNKSFLQYMKGLLNMGMGGADSDCYLTVPKETTYPDIVIPCRIICNDHFLYFIPLKSSMRQNFL